MSSNRSPIRKFLRVFFNPFSILLIWNREDATHAEMAKELGVGVHIQDAGSIAVSGKDNTAIAFGDSLSLQMQESKKRRDETQDIVDNIYRRR